MTDKNPDAPVGALPPVPVTAVAESLAAVSDDAEGFNPKTMAEIKKRLEKIVEETGADVDDINAMHPKDARYLQEQYIIRVKGGAYGEEEMNAWLAAEEGASRIITEQTEAETTNE